MKKIQGRGKIDEAPSGRQNVMSIFAKDLTSIFLLDYCDQMEKPKVDYWN